MSNLRLDDSTKVEREVKPQFMKSDAQQAKEHVTGAADNVASYLPGQHKTSDALNPNADNPHFGHDTGRLSGSDNNQNTTGWLERTTDQLSSFVEPNYKKSVGQQAHDTATPGNDSSITPHTGGPTITERIVGVKDTIVNAVVGDGSSNQNR
ncbi:hypothetical protein BCR39DRAFT_525449 [Naematelia encephala]|uniref:Uncharacterized protein n=1 Tax=Naematelia encephala TaxID=71784 RepID=A0A1Y2BAG5_9TREE|nr:hypothetical protein BCR39DRAFT_525449 [Naematelia encephala]